MRKLSTSTLRRMLVHVHAGGAGHDDDKPDDNGEPEFHLGFFKVIPPRPNSTPLALISGTQAVNLIK